MTNCYSLWRESHVSSLPPHRRQGGKSIANGIKQTGWARPTIAWDSAARPRTLAVISIDAAQTEDIPDLLVTEPQSDRSLLHLCPAISSPVSRLNTRPRWLPLTRRTAWMWGVSLARIAWYGSAAPRSAHLRWTIPRVWNSYAARTLDFRRRCNRSHQSLTLSAALGLRLQPPSARFGRTPAPSPRDSNWHCGSGNRRSTTHQPRNPAARPRSHQGCSSAHHYRPAGKSGGPGITLAVRYYPYSAGWAICTQRPPRHPSQRQRESRYTARTLGSARGSIRGTWRRSMAEHGPGTGEEATGVSLGLVPFSRKDEEREAAFRSMPVSLAFGSKVCENIGAGSWLWQASHNED